MRRLILILFSIGITTNVVLSSAILKSEENEQEQEEQTTVFPTTTAEPLIDYITDAISISSTVSPTTSSPLSLQRAVRQIALLDSLSCLPRFICNLSTRPTAKTGVVNDYGYLMKILFERDDDDDDNDDDEDDDSKKDAPKKKKKKNKTKNSGSTRTGTEDSKTKTSTGSSTTVGEKDSANTNSDTASSEKRSKTKKKEDSVSEEDSDESGGKGSDEDDGDDVPSQERPDYSEFDNLADKDKDEMILDDIMDEEPEMLPYVLAEMRQKAKKKAEAAAAKKKAAEEEALAKIKATLLANANANANGNTNTQSLNSQIGSTISTASNHGDNIVPVKGTDSSSTNTESSTTETKNVKTKGSSKRNKDKSTSKKTSSSTLFRQEASSPHSSHPTRLSSSSIVPGRIPGTYSSPYSSVPMYSAPSMLSPVPVPVPVSAHGSGQSPVRRRHNIVHKLNKNVLNKFGFGFSASRPQSGTVLETILPSFLYQKFKTGMDDDDDLDIPSSYYSSGSSSSYSPSHGYGNSYRHGSGSGFSSSSNKYPYGRNSKQPEEEPSERENLPDTVFRSSRQRLNSRFLRTFDEQKEAENAEIQNFIARKSRELNITTDPLEKYRVAVETGKKTKSARQCRFLFSRCPYTAGEVQAMIQNFQSFVVAQKTVGDKEVKLKLKKKPGNSASAIASDEPSTGGESTGKTKGNGGKVSTLKLPDVAGGTPIVQNLPMGDFEIRLKLKPKDEVIEITMGGSSSSIAMNASQVPANIREALETWTKNGNKGSSVRKNATVLTATATDSDDSIFDEDDSPTSSLNSTSSSNFLLNLNSNSTDVNLNTTAAPDKAFSPSGKTHNMMEGLPLIPSGPLPISAIYGTGSQSHHYRASEILVDGKRRKGNYRNSTTNKQYIGEIKSSNIPTRAPMPIPTLPTRYKVNKKSNGNSTVRPLISIITTPTSIPVTTTTKTTTAESVTV